MLKRVKITSLGFLFYFVLFIFKKWYWNHTTARNQSSKRKYLKGLKSFKHKCGVCVSVVVVVCIRSNLLKVKDSWDNKGWIHLLSWLFPDFWGFLFQCMKYFFCNQVFQGFQGAANKNRAMEFHRYSRSVCLLIESVVPAQVPMGAEWISSRC